MKFARPLAIVALLVSACAPQAAPAPGPAPTPAVVRGAGDELKLVFWQGPVILNPHLAAGGKDLDAARPVVEPLAWMGPEGKPIAALAAEVPTRANGGVAADFKTVTWKLKPGLKWSDGTELTSDDVVFTFTYMTDKATAAVSSFLAARVATVEAKDKATVVVTYKQPTANPYEWGTTAYSGIIQKAQFKDFMGAKAKEAPGNQKPIGTGPYMVREFKSNDLITYDMNPHYREADKPFFKTVSLKTVANAQTASRAVCSSAEADYAKGALSQPAAQLKPLIDGGRCDPVKADSAVVEQITLNYANSKLTNDQRSEPGNPHPFLSDVRVRRALAMAVNRKGIGEFVYGDGLAGSAVCDAVAAPVEFRSPNSARADACKYDLAAANRLLDEAGWVKGADGIRAKGGVKLELLYQTTVSEQRQQIQAIVKKDWESLGAKVELKAVPAAIFFSADAGSPDTAAKFFADAQQSSTQSAIDPEVGLQAWTSAEIKTRDQGWRGRNYSRYSNKDYDALAAQLANELDAAKRKDLVIKMSDILIADAVFIPLAATLLPAAAKVKALQGPTPNPWDGELWNIATWRK